MLTTSEILKRVRQIEIKTRGLSNHIFAGEYHSAFKGRGMSFSEVREYQYGDDVRAIDWNVTARFKHPFIKVFEEERELTMMLLVDVSGSSNFGTKQKMKNELMAEICAVLAFSAIKNNDKVGLLLFSSEVELFISPKKGKSHILRMIRELIAFQPKHKGTDVGKAMKALNNMVKKRCITFLLSDFVCTGYEDALKVTAKKHDLIGLNIYDDAERQIPIDGLMNVYDAETGKIFLADFSNKKAKEQYRQSFSNSMITFKNQFQKNGAGALQIATHDNYVPLLRNYFRGR
ncbi:MAG: hypothetical protein RIQ33_786 [Bacteroidota bacterium]|jgi:uncharacterized protein (DUF58 family)